MDDLERKAQRIAEHKQTMRQIDIDAAARSAEIIAEVCDEAVKAGTSGRLSVAEARKRLSEF